MHRSTSLLAIIPLSILVSLYCAEVIASDDGYSPSSAALRACTNAMQSSGISYDSSSVSSSNATRGEYEVKIDLASQDKTYEITCNYNSNSGILSFSNRYLNLYGLDTSTFADYMRNEAIRSCVNSAQSQGMIDVMPESPTRFVGGFNIYLNSRNGTHLCTFSYENSSTSVYLPPSN